MGGVKGAGMDEEDQSQRAGVKRGALRPLCRTQS
ncbi:hypothetical protein FHR50_001653 [Xanthomonas arboricola]